MAYCIQGNTFVIYAVVNETISEFTETGTVTGGRF
jgi:hypothetical protein